MKLCTILLLTLLYVVPVAAQDDTIRAVGFGEQDTHEPLAPNSSDATRKTTIATVTVPLKHITATEALDTLHQLGLITDKLFAAPSPDNKAVLMRLKEIPADGEESPIVEASQVLGSIDIASDAPTTGGTSSALGGRVAEAELRNMSNQLYLLRLSRDDLLKTQGKTDPDVIQLDKAMTALEAAIQEKLAAPIASSPEGKVTINLLDQNLLSIQGKKEHVEVMTQLLESSLPNTAPASTDIHRTLYQQAEASALKLAEEIRQQRAAGKDDQSLTDQKTKLKQWVRFAFQQRLIYQQLQLDEAERDLKLARDRLQRRELLADKIIERRAEQLERGESAKPQGLEEYLQQDPEYAQHILAIERVRQQLGELDASGDQQAEPTREQLQEQIAELQEKLQQRRQELEPRIRSAAPPTGDIGASGAARVAQSSTLELPPVKIQVVDEDGHPVSGTQIEMNNADDGRTVQVDGISNDRGVVIDQPIPYGKYNIRAKTSQGWNASLQAIVQFGKGLSLTIVAPKTEELSEVSFVYRAGEGWNPGLKQLPFGQPTLTRGGRGTGFASSEYQSLPKLENGIADIGYLLRFSCTRDTVQPDGEPLHWQWHPQQLVAVTSKGWWDVGDSLKENATRKIDGEYFNIPTRVANPSIPFYLVRRSEIQHFPFRFHMPGGRLSVTVREVLGLASDAVVQSLNGISATESDELYLTADTRFVRQPEQILGFFDAADWAVTDASGPDGLFHLSRPLDVQPGESVPVELKAAMGE